jgi:stage V sporulation protein S
MAIMRVSARSQPKSVAGAVAGMIRGGETVELQAVGAGAVNQAVKAAAVARGFLTEDGIDVVCIPRFVHVTIDGEGRMAIEISVERR